VKHLTLVPGERGVSVQAALAADYGRPVADLEMALQREVDRARHDLRALLGPGAAGS